MGINNEQKVKTAYVADNFDKTITITFSEDSI